MDTQTAFFEKRWQELSREVFTGMAEWRQQHPQATFKEIEEVLDEKLNEVRARMLEDLALASEAANWDGSDEEAVNCPQCGHQMSKRGMHKRQLQTQGGKIVRLRRQYGSCPGCGTAFFPPR